MIALLRGLWNVLRLPLWPLWWLGRLAARPRGDWVLVRVHGRLTELQPPRSLLFRWLPRLARVLPTPLDALRRLAWHVARDTRVRGVVFILPPLTAGWATTRALRDVLVRLREGGAQTAVYLPRGGGNRELYVATAADQVLLAPEATLMPLGLALEARYFKPLLDRLGLRVEAFARREYKTAAEVAVRESMSAPQQEQLGALLAALDRELVEAVAARDGLDEDAVRRLFEEGFFRGDRAVEARLADRVCYEDELPAVLGSEAQPARVLRAPRYLGYREGRFFRRLTGQPYVAVIQLRGVISEGPARPGARAADLDQVTRALRMAGRDRRVLGVLLHIDSPGGSATASDLLHREVERLAGRKPVVAYLGDVAASGGYYVAAATPCIVAQPGTITGSIGVLSAKVVASELLGSIGVRTETLRTAPHADMFSASRDLDERERVIMNRELDAFYRGFLEVVARGRGRTVEEVDALARGRVWAGVDAHARGLVDRLGGLDVALDEVRARLPLTSAVAARLRPRLVVPRGGDIPPPLPDRGEGAARAALTALVPGLGPLLDLGLGGERVLYYAPWLPRIE